MDQSGQQRPLSQRCDPQNVSARQTAQSDAAVEAAIAQVLASERAARDAVAQASADAVAIADKARERARAIAQRTERRMQHVREAYEAATQAKLAEIAAAAEGVDHRATVASVDRDRLVAAVAALAATLTGGPA